MLVPELLVTFWFEVEISNGLKIKNSAFDMGIELDNN